MLKKVKYLSKNEMLKVAKEYCCKYTILTCKGCPLAGEEHTCYLNKENYPHVDFKEVEKRLVEVKE